MLLDIVWHLIAWQQMDALMKPLVDPELALDPMDCAVLMVALPVLLFFLFAIWDASSVVLELGVCCSQKIRLTHPGGLL